MQDCLNCEEINGQCYECYILSGDEDRDRMKEEARIAEHKRLFDKVWCNLFATFDEYMEYVDSVLA